MAHELENMFSVKETPWHGLGKIVHEAPNAEEAIRLAGLDWKVNSEKIYQEINGKMELIESHRAMVRDSDNSVLGVVGKNYTPLQNDKAFEFFNPFIDSGLASFETAGSLREGKVIWVLAKLNKTPIEIGRGDVINKFLLLSNGHDGNMAVRVGFTPIRVVCANTLAMSHDKRESRLLRVNHSKKVALRIEQVQQIVNAADAKFEATAEQYKALARSDVNKKDLEKYVEIVFGFSTVEEQRRQIAKEKTIESITRLFETGKGSDIKASNGTMWGLYNSVAEMLSYERGKNEDTRLNSLWFAESANINRKALETAIRMAS
jgi:phage/plasmid-like protein (TIGR03299 family)